jgi:type I restriction-modification system DNA methylase subunit
MLNRSRAQKYLQKFDFESLFIEELGWDAVDHVSLPFEIDGEPFDVVSIAQKRGFIVYQCITSVIPARPVRVKLDRQLTDYSKSHLLVFGDEGKQKQTWMWVRQEPGKTAKPKFHQYEVKQSPEALLQKLEALIVDISEESKITHVDVAQRVKQGFNIEQVTKQFFQDFEGLHQQFCLEIEGIDSENDRRWYASVLLNRLMFVYFLQRRYFLDNGDPLYLQNKLKQCQSQKEIFYEFLKDLFFQGFAEPDFNRDAYIQKRLGKICYLNGGLFLKHSIEQKYSQIHIADHAFAQVFDLFSRYSWHLDDRPDKDPLEINPDVLGYIFEKYINQKEFGAYYTRPEITEYLCDRTINKLVIDRVNGLGYHFEGLNPLLEALDAPLCQALLNDILPTLTLLDPACGSGAFLVAAMKTLISIYQQVVERAKQFADQPKITQWLKEAANHPSLEYYIKKRIITDNLYGVDIMEEATEIAKLRLFLALVASAKTVNDLEPLPNIDFNIMAGNSLIGLIRVDAEGFDQLSQKVKGKGQKGGGVDPTQINLLEPTVLQGNLLQALAASAYQQILDEKNKNVALYKQHAFQSDAQRDPDHRSQADSILELRNQIDKLNLESQAKLNQLLLDEFSNRLGIKYEQAQLTGKPQKRVLVLADMDALEPFHWGYHFDAVFARGGFDAIIANPPWEVFKPNAKEFFANHSDLVTKKKMDIKAFEKEQKKLLQDPEIAAAWNEYQSQFPHVSAYFRSVDQYKNQISVVNGKKAGTDINLYKLFLEQCFNLLRVGGRCGIIIPSGIYTDLGAKQLREMLFSQCELDNLFGLSNEKFIFEGVHHAFKFALLSFEKGKQTEEFDAVFRINPREAIRSNDLGTFLHDQSQRIRLSVPLVRRLSPDSLSVMEFKKPIDIEIAQKMLRFPLLGEKLESRWNLKLTAEFHMTNDSHLFKSEPALGRLPLYEGKMIHQFTHQFSTPRYWIDEHKGRKAVLGKSGVDDGQKLDYQGYRLGFRDIAASTNERTMIATILPPSLFTGNTLIGSTKFENCKELLTIVSILDSFLFDFMIRQKVTAHCNMFYVYSTPVPRLQEGEQWFSEIVDRAVKLICTTPEFDDLAKDVGLGSHHSGITNEVERAKLRAELDGIIAHLYQLTEIEFAHILTTFPIVPDPTKQATLNAYRDVERGLIQ